MVESGIDFDDESNVFRDETVRFMGRNMKNYPGKIRRITAYIPDLHRTFTFYTNNFILSAEEIVFLYKNRWQVELFFKWIKQHLRVTAFWGQSENAVRTQIYTAICTYCLVAIIEHELKIERNIYEIMRVMGSSLLVKGDLERLFLALENEPDQITNCQLMIDFESD